MTKKKNITEYSEDELSLLVMNDEGLYNLRRNHDLLKEVLDSCYVYTPNQMAVLEYDLMSDEEEGATC